MRLTVALSLMSFLVCQQSSFIHGFDPTLTFEPASHFQLEDGSVLKYDVSVVTRFSDVNGDGRLDIIAASDGIVWCHIGVSSGLYKKKQPINTEDGKEIDTGLRGNRKTSMAYIDMNKDGFKDLLICRGKKLYVYLRNGTDTEGMPVFTAGRFAGLLEYNRFDVTDWDGDGYNDIIIGTFHGEFKIYHFFNESLSESATISTIKASTPYNPYPRVHDFNKDASEEILYSINWGYFTVVTKSSKAYKLYLNTNEIINVRETYKENQAPELADVDGDGVMDLITSGDTGDVVFFRGKNINGDIQLAQENITNILLSYPNDLGYSMENDSSLYNRVYDNHRGLQNILSYEIYTVETKKDIFIWYLHLVTSFPQYFSRQQWDQPCLAAHAGYVWTILLESQPDSPEHRKLVSAATRHTGYAARLLEDRGIILVNNDGAQEHKVKMIYDFMMMKNPSYYSLSSISQSSYLQGRAEKYKPLRDSSVNIFSGADYGSNSFPEDCRVCTEVGRSPSINAFLAALAHEVAHNELDQKKAKAYNHTLFQRKYRIIQNATTGHVVWKTPITSGYDQELTKELFMNNSWWDGVKEWDAAFQTHFETGLGSNLTKNSIRPFHMGFFVKYPQEAFATLANEYASDTKLMLDFAMERCVEGYLLCLDWFLLMAEYYTVGGANIPIMVIDSEGKMNISQATVARNIDGYISQVTFNTSLVGASNYYFKLDKDGFVVSCSSDE